MMRRAMLAVGLCLGCALWACAGDAPDGSAETSTDAEASKMTPLPGAPEIGPELRGRLAKALAAKGAGYVPRTHHLNEDGSPRYTNRLILESNPYLNQHAHNPVNWYPWGDEAFETAERLGRPVFLSVGYSTCHWCHVMEKESFEDEEIARYLNENYIAIKVDREERPDIDSIYMTAVQAMTGRGGWPMSVWLTPDRAPFYGGTYFPARDGDRGTRTGFLTLLANIKQQYDEHPDKAESLGRQLTERIRRSMAPMAGSGDALPDATSFVKAAGFYKGQFDPVWGGTRRAPKFPSNFPNRLLLREHARTGDDELLTMVTLTLEKMAAGGMHDHVGGGFHRYSTDGRWLVPHFEKMLYDNALLTVVYLEGYQATGREDFAEVARRILEYVRRGMTSPEGAFYSATDADSPTPDGHDEEGWFFTWTPAELKAVLGEEWAAVVSAYYGVTAGGNFEGRNILHPVLTVEQAAEQSGLSPDRVRAILSAAVERLYEARLERPAPLRDDKILTSWNGLMISAFAVGGRVLDDPSFVEQAERAADFILANLRRDGRLLRSYKDGRARHNAYLDDYAFLIAGLLDLHEATFDPRWLGEAIALQRTFDEHYRDPAGGYFMTSDDHESLLAREKPAYDGAEPSGNSVALMNLLRLHELTTDDAYRSAADALLTAFAPALTRSPNALTAMLVALDFRLGSPREIVIVTKGPKSDAEPFLAELRNRFAPNRVVIVARQGKDLKAQSELVPLLEGKVAKKGKATAYVCQGGVCKLPTTDVGTFVEQIERGPLQDPDGS
jgi:uncharacterized protein YyaL (SSP411 family)